MAKKKKRKAGEPHKDPSGKRKPYTRTPRKRKYVPEEHCGAKCRDGLPCTLGKGEGSDHPGEGKCWRHGSGKKGGRPGGRPPTHGYWSKKLREGRIGKKIERIEAENLNVLDLRPERVMLSALLEDFIERKDEYDEQLAAFYQTWDPAVQRLLNFRTAMDLRSGVIALRTAVNARPRQVLDISDSARLIREIGSLVEKIDKIENKRGCSWESLKKILERVGVITIQVLRSYDVERGDEIVAELEQQINSINPEML